jgi:hypothetical protein
MSYIFFALMLIPFIGFLVWMIKQDKKKNYLGLFFLVFGALVALYTIIKLDQKYLHPEKLDTSNQAVPKSSNFK